MRGIVTQEVLQNDKESVISDSYGESYDQSPDAHEGRFPQICAVQKIWCQN